MKSNWLHNFLIYLILFSTTGTSSVPQQYAAYTDYQDDYVVNVGNTNSQAIYNKVPIHNKRLYSNSSTDQHYILLTDLQKKIPINKTFAQDIIASGNGQCQALMQEMGFCDIPLDHVDVALVQSAPPSHNHYYAYQSLNNYDFSTSTRNQSADAYTAQRAAQIRADINQDYASEGSRVVWTGQLLRNSSPAIRDTFDSQVYTWAQELAACINCNERPSLGTLLSLYNRRFLADYSDYPQLQASSTLITHYWQKLVALVISSYYTIGDQGYVVRHHGSPSLHTYTAWALVDFLKAVGCENRLHEYLRTFAQEKNTLFNEIREQIEHANFFKKAWSCIPHFVDSWKLDHNHSSSHDFSRLQEIYHAGMSGNSAHAKQIARPYNLLEQELLAYCHHAYQSRQPKQQLVITVHKKETPVQPVANKPALLPYAKHVISCLEKEESATVIHRFEQAGLTFLVNAVSQDIKKTSSAERIAFNFGVLDSAHIFCTYKESNTLYKLPEFFTSLHDIYNGPTIARIQRIAHATYTCIATHPLVTTIYENLHNKVTHPIQNGLGIAATIALTCVTPTPILIAAIGAYGAVCVWDLAAGYFATTHVQNNNVVEHLSAFYTFLQSDAQVKKYTEFTGNLIADGLTGYAGNKIAVPLLKRFFNISLTSFVTQKVSAAFKKLKNKTKKVIRSARKKLRAAKQSLNNATQEMVIATTPEGLQIVAIEPLEQTSMQFAQESGKGGAKVIQELITIPEVTAAVTKESAELIQKLSPYLTAIDQEITSIRPLFDMTHKGFGDFVNKYIKVPYRHILGMDFNIARDGIAKLQGFHHDFMGAIEKSGLVKLVNKVVYENGCYKAEVWFNGRIVPKTFFPQDWSQEKVISKIVEAYNNFKAAGATTFKINPDGKYAIEAITNEGIKILIYMTKNGEITTACPNLG